MPPTKKKLLDKQNNKLIFNQSHKEGYYMPAIYITPVEVYGKFYM